MAQQNMVPVGRAARAHLVPRLVETRVAQDGDTLYKDSLGVLPSGEEQYFYSSRQRPRGEERREAEERFVAAWMQVEAERQIVAGVADRGDLESGGLEHADRARGDLAGALAQAAGASVDRWVSIAVRVEHGRERRARRGRRELAAIADRIRIAGPSVPYVDRFHIYPTPRSARWEGRVEVRTNGGWSVNWTLRGTIDHRGRRTQECRIGGRVGAETVRGGDRVPERAVLQAVSREVAEGVWRIWRGAAR